MTLGKKAELSLEKQPRTDTQAKKPRKSAAKISRQNDEGQSDQPKAAADRHTDLSFYIYRIYVIGLLLTLNSPPNVDRSYRSTRGSQRIRSVRAS